MILWIELVASFFNPKNPGNAQDCQIWISQKFEKSTYLIAHIYGCLRANIGSLQILVQFWGARERVGLPNLDFPEI